MQVTKTLQERTAGGTDGLNINLNLGRLEAHLGCLEAHLRCLEAHLRCYLGLFQISKADYLSLVDGLKIKHSISMCLLVFERAYLSCFLTDFKKIYDEKKLEKKIFQMRLIPGLQLYSFRNYDQNNGKLIFLYIAKFSLHHQKQKKSILSKTAPGIFLRFFWLLSAEAGVS